MAVNSADTEASNRPGLANDDVSREAAGKKGKAGRTAKFRAKINTNQEASAPQSYNLGGRTLNQNYGKPNSGSTNKTC